jgi:hypothetical protein
MNEGTSKNVVVKCPYTTPKLVEYGSVSKLTEAKSGGPSDVGSAVLHNVP